MTFQQYLEKHGPSVKKLAERDIDIRAQISLDAYLRYHLVCSYADCDFVQGFDLATEVMAYMHMAQDAHKQAEGCPRCGQQVQTDKEYGIVCAECFADNVKAAHTEPA